MIMPSKEDMTEPELKLIGAIRHLKVKPEKVETTKELEKFMKEYEKDSTERQQFPRLSIFYGEEGIGEVGYQTKKYAGRVEELFGQAVEVKALTTTQECILKNVFYQGIKQLLKQCGNLKYETIKDFDRFKIEMRKIKSELEE